MKKLLYVFLVVVLAGCAKPAGPKKIDIDIHNLYDKVYGPQNKMAVAYMCLADRWWKKDATTLKTAKKSWWKTDGSTTRPTTQPTSRPVHDVVVVLTPNSVNEKVVKSEIIGDTKISTSLPKTGLEVVTGDEDDVEKNKEYLKLEQEFE